MEMGLYRSSDCTPYLNRIDIDHVKSNFRFGVLRHVEFHKSHYLVAALKISPNL